MRNDLEIAATCKNSQGFISSVLVAVGDPSPPETISNASQPQMTNYCNKWTAA
ncbi:hypothetical protein QTJ16_000078 [Diplocarpon rosae]|uniref:Uncharacterized protein n=1 Tax=Diplocarpon rosae TaxID=946125 RepID=A0AAD9T3B9_9HELO|nr:hypothetical protein QTJ16_000078 [Diplocarpon rosae]